MIPSPTSITALSDLSSVLDGSDHPARVAWLDALKKKELIALYELAAGQQTTPEAMAGADGEIVIQRGKNSLPMFNHFQKRVTRYNDRIQGYNHQDMMWFTGPGHFIVRPSEDTPGELWFDYIWEPDAAPDRFPPIKSNKSGISRFVYGGMIDTVRRVSEHASIGAAIRGGKPSGDYFALCRDGLA